MASVSSAKPIVVVGAGLSGCCIALLLSKLFGNKKIIILENRRDYREELQKQQKASQENENNDKFGQFNNAATRSINLALSHRGICALKECGLFDEIIEKDLLILMKGRYVHLDNSQHSIQNYGQNHEGIYSISRLTLNCLFLDHLDKQSNVEIRYECKVQKVFKNGDILFNENDVIHSQFVLGCDGAYSSVRNSLQRLDRYNFSMTYIDHGYKELTIFPAQNRDPTNDDDDDDTKSPNAFRIPQNYLHIWPKHDFMLIGLPNPDCTFTCTLFAPWSILSSLSDDKEKIKLFFDENFPDFHELCPHYIEQCMNNPSSPLAYLNLSKWNYKGKVCLLGDSAHAIVPFYGQGMNAGLEDCLILFDLFKREMNMTTQWNNVMSVENIFDEFSKYRQPACEALSELSLQNYVEMRSLTAKKWFVYKKKLETFLNFYVPNMWKPIYSMVAFSRIPYDTAIKRAKKQDKYLSVAFASTVVVSTVSLLMMAKEYGLFEKVKNKLEI